MRKKRRRASANQALRKHLKRLGFESETAYLEWCALNGFEATFEKCAEDRQAELTTSLITGPSWRGVHFHGPQPEPCPQVCAGDTEADTLEKILSGRVAYGFAKPKKFSAMCRAVERLRGPKFNEHLKTFRWLIQHCAGQGVTSFEYSKSVQQSLPFPTCSFAEALALLAMHRQAWIRPLDAWRPEVSGHLSSFRSLVQHLLAQHPIPDFLINSWFHSDLQRASEELKIFRHVAAGHSVRTIVRFDDSYGRRMSHHFMQAPSHMSLHQALRWGQARTLGSCEKLAKLICHTFLGDRFDGHAFWKSVIRWFVAHSELNREDVAPILDYLNNQRFGVGNVIRYETIAGKRVRVEAQPAQPRLTMKGREPAALLRDVQQWHRDLAAYGRDAEFVWERSHILPLRWEEEDGNGWETHELLGNQALRDEGAKLNHCVASYAYECAEGETTIWSLRRQQPYGKSTPSLTVEICPHTRRIIQARGLGNRLPTAEEEEVLDRWAEQQLLAINREL